MTVRFLRNKVGCLRVSVAAWDAGATSSTVLVDVDDTSGEDKG